MRVCFSNHAGSCCGVRQSNSIVGTVDDLSFIGVDKRFLFKTRFSGDQFIPSLQAMLAGYPNSAAVVMGDWCWFAFKKASPVRRFKRPSDMTFLYASQNIGGQLVSLHRFGFGGIQLEENFFQEDRHYECCLLTSQINPGFHRLASVGFVAPFATTNPNTGRKICLFLKGPVENVPIHH
jgi:hypothetical protein